MATTPTRAVQRVYLLLLFLHTLAASFIWGINTLFLLDAGLSNTAAFAANAFFTAGMVLFEVPTGIVADMRGRRTSYLLGTLTLAASTVLYLCLWRISAPLWAWASASMLLGLGFTFFSGAVDAWLVDALTATGHFRDGGTLDAVLARGEIVEGAAMLGGAVAGGVIAQATNLGVPYILRVVVLVSAFAVAFVQMKDIGFTPVRGAHPLRQALALLRASLARGMGNPPVRWMMLTSLCTGGVSIYAFYAMQPYLLELYGDERAYSIAGIAAAAVAGAQIAGGLLVPYAARLFDRRTSVVIAGFALSAVALALIGALPRFWPVVALLVMWALMYAAVTPVRKSYLNGLIASEERATVLSFDSLLESAGAVVTQPLLGRAADVWSYPASYVVSSVVQALATPFAWLARREHPVSDFFAAPGDSSTERGPDLSS